MTYCVCLGKQERYGNFAQRPGKKIYKDFRFRDPFCPDTGRTKYILPNSANFSDWIISVDSTIQLDEIKKYTDSSGLVWKIRTGNKPDDHQFSRKPTGKILDNLNDSAWEHGSRVVEKNNGHPSSQNVGFYQSSTWRELKEKGLLK